MFLRIDKLPIELPASPVVDPIAAKNVQELLGGRIRRDVDFDELHLTIVRHAWPGRYSPLLCSPTGLSEMTRLSSL